MKTLVSLLTILALASAAHAQTSAENTRAACTDHLDNDGDGHVDCADQDCQDFNFCAPTLDASSDQPRLRSRGTTFVVVGATLFSLGIVLGGASSALWMARSGDSFDYNPEAQGAVAMDVVSVAMIGAGIPLLAIGAGKLAEARRPRVALRATSLAVHF